MENYRFVDRSGRRTHCLLGHCGTTITQKVIVKYKVLPVNPVGGVALKDKSLTEISELSKTSEIGEPLSSLHSRAAAGPHGLSLLLSLFFLVNFITRQCHLISFPLEWGSMVRKLLLCITVVVKGAAFVNRLQI